jgi:uncharacterized protein
MLAELSLLQWGVILFCAILIGMSKSGLQGISIVAIPLLAWIFGGKSSTGILLPILIVADAFAVLYYHRHAHWGHILRAIPWTFAGILIALIIGNLINDQQFKRIIAVIIFVSVGLMVWRDLQKKNQKIPTQWWFAALLGLSGGFATMIGNAAGPIFALYLLAMRLPKNEYIGTSAWFFFITNLFKFPLHLFVWKTITFQSLAINLTTIPFVAAGAFSAIWLVKKIPNTFYRWFIILITILSSLVML